MYVTKSEREKRKKEDVDIFLSKSGTFPILANSSNMKYVGTGSAPPDLSA